MKPKFQNSQRQLQEPKYDVPSEVPVLIVGAGPVGLSTSLLLSHHGIRSLLVEQHPGTSIYPKARMINCRTLEIFRQIGMEDAVHEIAIPHTRNFVGAISLAGKELFRSPIETLIPEPVREWSPTWGCTSTQDVLEPVLLAQARRLEPAQIRFSTQLVSFEQNNEYVLATLVHRPSGRVSQVRARYLVAADGSQSPVREALGIRMLGQPVLAYRVDVLLQADLSPWVGEREINICLITNPEAAGLLLYNGGKRWRYTAFYDPDRGQRPEDFTPEHCRQLIRTAVGVPDLAVEVGDISPWNDAALVAERFSDRRAFLAGDATHVMSPTGGFGMNVGIQDAHNLAWKLAAVLKGWGTPALLASYEAERMPVSRLMVEQMARNVGSLRVANAGGSGSSPSQGASQPPAGRPELPREHGLVFGASYASPVIVPDGSAPVEVANPVTDYAPNARPGSRAPHVWLERAGGRCSTLDLFGREFVLLAGAKGQNWCDAATAVSGLYGVPIQAFRVGPGADVADPGQTWARTYGIEEDGAVLVRPDGYVAWRCATAKGESISEIELALKVALARQSVPQREISVPRVTSMGNIDETRGHTQGLSS